MAKKSNSVKNSSHILYKIYYGNLLVYLGRTNQPLQSRLRGHFFNKPMHRKLDIFQVTKIEFAICATVADMYLYEVYYINKYHPPLNIDDNSFYDDLTVSLPELKWEEFECKLMEKWKIEFSENEKQKATNEKLKKRNFGGLSKLRKMQREEENKI